MKIFYGKKKNLEKGHTWMLRDEREGEKGLIHWLTQLGRLAGSKPAGCVRRLDAQENTHLLAQFGRPSPIRVPSCLGEASPSLKAFA